MKRDRESGEKLQHHSPKNTTFTVHTYTQQFPVLLQYHPNSFTVLIHPTWLQRKTQMLTKDRKENQKI